MSLLGYFLGIDVGPQIGGGCIESLLERLVLCYMVVWGFRVWSQFGGFMFW